MQAGQGYRQVRRAGTGEDLSREAARLLSGLAGFCAYAVADPTEEGVLVLRRERAGVSLGGGRFPAKAAEELLRRDLVEPVEGRPRPTFRLSGPGAARLRREAAGAADPEADLAFAAQHRDLVTERIEVRAAGARSCSTPAKAPSSGFAGARTRPAGP